MKEAASGVPVRHCERGAVHSDWRRYEEMKEKPTRKPA
jgi:hypothetical protein